MLGANECGIRPHNDKLYIMSQQTVFAWIYNKHTSSILIEKQSAFFFLPISISSAIYPCRYVLASFELTESPILAFYNISMFEVTLAGAGRQTCTERQTDAAV